MKLTDAVRAALYSQDDNLKRMAVDAMMLIFERQRVVCCTDDEMVLLAAIRQRVMGNAPKGSLNRSA